MTLNNSALPPNSPNSTHDKINGADITSQEIKADGKIGGRFTSANGWTTEDGKLPGFGATNPLPAHLQ